MGRGRGQQALPSLTRHGRLSGQLWPSGTLAPALSASSWGWRSQADVIFERHGVGVIGLERPEGRLLAVVFARPGPETEVVLTSLVEVGAGPRQAASWQRRLVKIAQRLSQIKEAGWDLMRISSGRCAISTVLEPDQIHREWIWAPGQIGGEPAEHLVGQIERDLANLDLTNQAQLNRRALERRFAEDERLLRQIIATRCSQLPEPQQGQLLALVIDNLNRQGQVLADQSMFPAMVDEACSQLLRQQAQRQAARRLRRIISARHQN